jgi:ABC-2 type transport system ATP-binding protein
VDLTRIYGKLVAVGGLSLEVQPGEIFGLLGPNGAGKTTTLAMLTGLVPASSGHAMLFGKDLRNDFLSIAPRIGVLFERQAFYDHLTAHRNLLLLSRLSGKDLTVDRALDRVGLLHAAHRKVGTFSTGMRQRLGVAQALMTEPELLILDEPTNHLDAESSREVLHLLRTLSREAGVTVIYASHMLHEVEAICDRVAILNKGRLLRCDRLDTLLSYDQHDVDVLIDAPEGAARRLAPLDWVASAEPGQGRVHVMLAPGGSIHQLTAFLVGGGFRLSGVVPRRRTLQDYFLKVLNT